MKFRSGDMLVIDDRNVVMRNGVLKLQIIGRNDVPRVEREGRGWGDGAAVVLVGADVAEFLDALNNSSGEHVIGDSGLSMKVEYEAPPGSVLELPYLVLSAKGVSVRLTWPERTLLVYAVRSIAWRMFSCRVTR